MSSLLGDGRQQKFFHKAWSGDRLANDAAWPLHARSSQFLCRVRMAAPMFVAKLRSVLGGRMCKEIGGNAAIYTRRRRELNVLMISCH